MLAKVAEFLTRYSTHAGATLAVAVSGGADSVCLLTVLRELGHSPHVLHLNHHLRGAESDLDEQFVHGLAAGLRFHRADADLSAVKGNLEQAARDARRAFFTQLLDRGIIDSVALAHTRDDQAETVLMRLLRGTGQHGLAAMRPVSGRFLRPLLETSRAEIETFLRARGISWREDRSNRDPRFTRNRIRHQLLPLLEREYNPEVRSALSHLATTSQAEEDWWQLQMERHPALSKNGPGAAILNTALLKELHPAVIRRVIRHAIEIAKGNLRQITFDQVETVAALAASTRGYGRVPLPGMMATRSFDQLRIAVPRARPTGFSGPVTAGETYDPPGVILETVDPAGRAKVKEDLAWVDVPALLELREWQAGDAYCPVGEKRDWKLKNLFQRARIPVWDRAGWPVLVGGGQILWSRQFGPAARFAAPADCPKVLRVRELRHPPELAEGIE